MILSMRACWQPDDTHMDCTTAPAKLHRTLSSRAGLSCALCGSIRGRREIVNRWRSGGADKRTTSAHICVQFAKCVNPKWLHVWMRASMCDDTYVWLDPDCRESERGGSAVFSVRQRCRWRKGIDLHNKTRSYTHTYEFSRFISILPSVDLYKCKMRFP